MSRGRPSNRVLLRRAGCPALILAACLTVLPAGGGNAGEGRLVLRYDKPAAAFEEALPLGNGRIGAMVFGGPASDRIMLNDSTLWTGRADRPGREPRRDQGPAHGPRGARSRATTSWPTS